MSTPKTLTLVIATALAAVGCAVAGGKSAAEANPGKYVAYDCEGGKRFSTRFDAESGGVRIRTQEGSTDLDKGARGLFRDEGGDWVLALADGKSTELVHKGKAQYVMCAAE